MRKMLLAAFSRVLQGPAAATAAAAGRTVSAAVNCPATERGGGDQRARRGGPGLSRASLCGVSETRGEAVGALSAGPGQGGRCRLSRWRVARRHSPGTWAAAGPARSRRVRALGGRARAGGERPRWAPPAGTARLLRWGRGFVLWKWRWREGWQHGRNRSQTGYLVPAAK